MAEVVLNDVCKTYPGDVLAVDRVSLSVQDGEFLVLVGPSGCGKSTTLRMIAGLEEISAGEIFIGDRLVNDVPPKDRDIAMVFQNYALYPHMTVERNLGFGLRLRKTPKNEIQRRVSEAAKILGIEELLQRRPSALSGGQKQRVAVGRAIVRDPSVFLFDEPLSNLDAKLRTQTRVEIKQLHQRLAATMIYVTHDQVEAMTMGDRIVVMKDGVVQQVDTPMALYHQPANRFVGSFIGTPQMNFFEGELHAGIFRAAAGIELPCAGPDGPAALGIRPEKIVRAVDGLVQLEARVEVVEPMGSETLAYLNCCGFRFVSRLDPDMAPEPGENIEVSLLPDGIHFFGGDGNRIG